MTLGSFFKHSVDLPSPGQPLDPKLLPAGGGVFAFTDSSGRLIQMLGCQNIRRSATLRLSAPPEGKATRRARLHEVARRVWWVPTGSVFETSLRYLHLARALFPGDYPRRLGFGPVWFARAETDQPFPRWIVDKYALDGKTIDIGPFFTRRECAQFVDMLEDAFDLCRHYSILQQAPAGKACAYFEMGRCAAPCNGGMSMEAYRLRIEASARFARGDTESWFGEADSRMRAAAGARKYELAAGIKATIDRATRLLASAGRIRPTPDDFRYLVVQRVRPSKRVIPFFIVVGNIAQGDPVELRDVPELIDSWVSRIGPTKSADPGSAQLRSEQVWLLSHFLRKGSNARGVYLHHTQCGSPESIADIVVRYFSEQQSPSCAP